MRFIYKIVFPLLFFCLIHINVFSQISSNANFSTKTWYSDSDTVFVFCTNNSAGGSLFAFDSTLRGGYTFQWFKYNSLINSFDIPLFVFNYNDDSTRTDINNLESGGYKVVLTKADTSQEYVAWIFNNVNLSLDLQILDPLSCEILELNGTPGFTTDFHVFSPLNGESKSLANYSSKYLWEFESEDEVSIPSYDYFYTSTGILPLEDTKCKLTLIDNFGCEISDSVLYTAIATKASFTLVHLDRDGNEITSSDSSLVDQAPMIIRFVNKSRRGSEFVWFFGDTLVKKDQDYIYTSDFNLQPEHTYYYTEKVAGLKYTPKLKSTSIYGCVDSVSASVKLDPSKLEFPNIFSPNNDGINDVFIIDPENYKSIRSFKISIFNRTGQLMHEYEGEIYNWKGWDGKVRGKGDASEGTYFFVLEVTGWDGVNYNNDKVKADPYFGFIGLYRNK